MNSQPGGGDGGRTSSGFSFRKAPKSIQVVNRQVTIVGPAGFCVDKVASHTSRQGAFVLLGSCAAISENPRDDHPRVPAVLTASVSAEAGGADPAELERLAGFFKSTEGRAALSRSGQAQTVQVHKVSRSEGAVLIHVSDTAPGGLDAVTVDYWRGVFSVKGHVVTVTVTGFASRPLAADAGLELIRSFVAQVRAANPVQEKTGGGLSNFLKSLL